MSTYSRLSKVQPHKLWLLGTSVQKILAGVSFGRTWIRILTLAVNEPLSVMLNYATVIFQQGSTDIHS